MKIAALGTLALFLFVPHAHAIRVLAATNDLGALARAVGENRVTVEVVADPAADPHVHAVVRENLLQARRADLYLKVGLGLDPWSEALLDEAAKPALRILDCSTAITALEGGEGAGNHPDGDPHYWLDPMQGVAIARLLARNFGEGDRMYAAVYQANAERFAAAVAERLPAWDKAMRGHDVVAVHDEWPYLADRFGLRIMGTLEPAPGAAASLRDVTALVGRLPKDANAIVLWTASQDGTLLKPLRKRAGVTVATVPASCAEPTPEAYLALFDRLAEAIGGTALAP